MAKFVSIDPDKNGNHATMEIADDRLKHYEKASWMRRWVKVADSADVPNAKIDTDPVFTSEKKTKKIPELKNKDMTQSNDLIGTADLEDSDNTISENNEPEQSKEKKPRKPRKPKEVKQ